jgi:hypothetical protein
MDQTFRLALSINAMMPAHMMSLLPPSHRFCKYYLCFGSAFVHQERENARATTAEYVNHFADSFRLRTAICGWSTFQGRFDEFLSQSQNIGFSTPHRDWI